MKHLHNVKLKMKGTIRFDRTLNTLLMSYCNPTATWILSKRKRLFHASLLADIRSNASVNLCSREQHLCNSILKQFNAVISFG